MHNAGQGQDPPPETDETTGLSRRSLMRSAVGVGAATVAAGFLASALAEPAAAAPAPATPTHSDPVVAHVRDARTGEIDLFIGTRHVRVRDHDLAVRLADAAR